MGLALAEPEENDHRVADDGIRLWVDPAVERFYNGGELDWDEEEGGFAFRHPFYDLCYRS